MRGTLMAVLAAASLVSTGASAEGPPVSPPPVAPARASILETEQFVVHSKIEDADFLIQVAKPLTLSPTPAGQRQPVTYVLDGTYLFGMMTPLARLMPLEQTSQATYVVGVGFPEEGLMAYNLRRQRELIHVAAKNSSGQMTGGDGAKFERFIKEELRPLIERRYPVDPARSYLAGHSLGGLFAANLLANDPQAFAGYMIGSPSLQFDATLPDRLRAVAAKGGGRRVFVSVGAEEGPMVARADAVEAALSAPGSTFAVARRTFAGESHVSGQGAWLSGGLRYILPPPPRQPPAR